VTRHLFNILRNLRKLPWNHSTGYTEFESDGTLRLYGAATAWYDIDFDLSKGALGASAPDIGTIGAGTIEYLLFDGNATVEDVSGQIEIQHDVKLDVIKPHIHWIPTTADAGDVKWNLTYTVGNTGDGESETTLSVTMATPAAIENVFSVFGDIDISSFSAGAQLSFRLYRDPGDAADTYSEDVAAKTLGFHVERQSLGTRTVVSE